VFSHDGKAQPFRTASGEAAGHASLNAAHFGQAWVGVVLIATGCFWLPEITTPALGAPPLLI